MQRKQFGPLEYGASSIEWRDIVYLENACDSSGCLRKHVCHSGPSVDDIICLSRYGNDLHGRVLSRGEQRCDIGKIFGWRVGSDIIDKYEGILVQVLEVTKPDAVGPHSELRGTCRCVVIGRSIWRVFG